MPSPSPVRQGRGGRGEEGEDPAETQAGPEEAEISGDTLLVERRGMFAPILYALNTIALSLGLFSLITHLSYRQGVGSLSTSDRDISSVDIALLYLWEFTGSIPLADINGTFDWQQPVSYHGPIIAAQILFFKIAIIVPVVVTISEAWKSRDGRNQRYRRGRAAKLARTFGLD